MRDLALRKSGMCPTCGISTAKFSGCPYCSHSLALLKDSRYSLAVDGDYREKKWASLLTKQVPAYERFWKTHVVPLTYRIYARGNLVRPSVGLHLIDIADASYASMYHLTQCHEYARLADSGKISTEDLYCFFSHLRSLTDAVASVAAAVNEGAPVFEYRPGFRFDGRGRLSDWRAERAGAGYEELWGWLKDYRNLLVHHRPIFVLDGRIPRRESFEERRWSGLTAKGRIALDRKVFDTHFEDVDRVMKPVCADICLVGNSVWATAEATLDWAWKESRKYRDGQRQDS